MSDPDQPARDADLAAQAFVGTQAAARLADLGLTNDDILETVLAAQNERLAYSGPRWPSNTAGFMAYSAGVFTLASRLEPQGWVKTETKGLARVLNPDTRVAVAVAAGDVETGRLWGKPTSRNERGSVAALLVRSNQIQLNLPFEEEGLRPLPPVEEQITWWLLIYSDKDGSTVRAELSLPVGITDNRLASWQQRIIIDVSSCSTKSAIDLEDELPPIDFEVRISERPS